MAEYWQFHRVLKLIGILFFLGTIGCTLDINVASQAIPTPLVSWQPPVGTPDSSFGDHGFVQPKVSINADLGDNYFNVVEDPFGKLYMAGAIGPDFVVRSMNADSSPNAIFGNQGLYRETIPFFRNARVLLGAQGFGTYLYISILSGSESPGGTLRFMRMDLEGQIINSVEFSVPTVYEVVDMVWAKDESIFLILQDEDGVKITKLDRDGNIATSWGNAGSWIGDDRDVSNFSSIYKGLQEAADGTVYVLLDTTGNFRILHCLDNQGHVKTSFQGTGYLKLTTFPLNIAGIVMDPSERLVIYGSRSSVGYAARYTAAGVLDTTFNSPQGFVEVSEAGARVKFEHVVAEGDGTYQFYGYVDKANPSIKYYNKLLGQDKRAYARWSGSSSGTLSLAVDLSQSAPLDPLGEVYGSFASSSFGYQPRMFRSVVSGDIYYLSNTWTELLPMDNLFSESHLFKLGNDGSLAWSTSKVFQEKLDFEIQLNSENIIPTRDESFYYFASINMGREGYASSIFHLKENGSFDGTYGSAGAVRISNGLVRSGVVDNQGRLWVSGLIYDDLVSAKQFVVMRFLASGMPDTSFGTQGKTVFNLSPDSWDETEKPAPLILTADGGVITLIISYDQSLDETTTHLWKVNGAGQTQTSWGTAGVLVVPSPADLRDYIEILQSHGEWLYLKTNVSEDTENAFNDYSFIARVNISTGQVDDSFGNSDSYWKKIGITENSPLYIGNSIAQAMDSQGRIYVVSEVVSEEDSSSYYRIDRYTLDGQMDLSFRNGLGYLVTGLEPDDYFKVSDLVVQQDDTVLLLENHSYSTDDDYAFSLLKALDSKGELITGFGSNGQISSYDVGSGFLGKEISFGKISVSRSGRIALEVGSYEGLKILKLE